MHYFVQNVSVFFWLQMREWKDCTSPTCNAQNRLLNDHYYCSWTLPCLGAIIYCEGVFVCCYPSMVLFELVHQLLQLCAVYPIGSMVLLYMVLHGSHQYTPFMLALIYQHHGSVMGLLGSSWLLLCWWFHVELVMSSHTHPFLIKRGRQSYPFKFIDGVPI